MLWVLVVVFCGPFIHCVKHRRVVTRPGVEVRVVDVAGAPITGASVVVHWWSYPYGRLHQSHRFTTDATGAVVTREESQDERVAPLCMHGVPEHHYTLCVGLDGAGWRALEIEPRTEGAITVTLGGGSYAGECDDGERARFGGGNSPADAGP